MLSLLSRVAGCDDEVAVERQPADGEYQDDHNHHLHHLWESG